MTDTQNTSVTKPGSLKSTAWFVLGMDLAAAALVWVFRTDIFKANEPVELNEIDVPALVVCAALLGLGVVSFAVLTALGHKQEKRQK